LILLAYLSPPELPENRRATDVMEGVSISGQNKAMVVACSSITLLAMLVVLFYTINTKVEFDEDIAPMRRRPHGDMTIFLPAEYGGHGEPIGRSFNITTWAPLSDHVQLFAFSDKINENVCVSIESALLSGWKYQLIGPTVSFLKKAGSLDGKANKIFMLSLLLGVLPKDSILVFADAMDIVFQRSAQEFEEALKSSKVSEKYVLFSAEKNCWPFNRSNKKTYHCPLMQGTKWRPDSKEPALGCKLQAELYEKTISGGVSTGASRSGSPAPPLERPMFLNSGLSVGFVEQYRAIAAKSIDMTTTLPSLCLDDQGLLAWQMVSASTTSTTSSVSSEGKQNETRISLDYGSEFFASLNDRDVTFDSADGFAKVWKYTDKSKDNTTVVPFMLHHNGNGKRDVVRGRDLYNHTSGLIVDWKRKHKGLDVVQELARGRLFVDGIERKYEEVCGNHIAARYSAARATSI
jgi:hypothetical protein